MKRDDLKNLRAAAMPPQVISEEVLLEMVDLATRGASAAEWTQLCQRSASVSVEQEPIEVVEARALWAWRRGEAAEARVYLEQALALAGQIPNLMEDRLRRVLTRLPPAR